MFETLWCLKTTWMSTMNHSLSKPKITSPLTEEFIFCTCPISLQVSFRQMRDLSTKAKEINSPYWFCNRFGGIFRHKDMAGKSVVCWVFRNETEIPANATGTHEVWRGNSVVTLSVCTSPSVWFLVSLNTYCFWAISYKEESWLYHIELLLQRTNNKLLPQLHIFMS